MICSFRNGKWVEWMMTGASQLSGGLKKLLPWAWRFPWDLWVHGIILILPFWHLKNIYLSIILGVLDTGRKIPNPRSVLSSWIPYVPSGNLRTDFTRLLRGRNLHLVVQNLLNFVFSIFIYLRNNENMDDKVWDCTHKYSGWSSGECCSTCSHLVSFVFLEEYGLLEFFYFDLFIYLKNIPCNLHLWWKFWRFHDQGVRARMVNRDFTPRVGYLH